MEVDLHTHTTFSDGSYTPEEILKMATQKGLKAIAITDHDNIDGLFEAKKFISQFDVELINGIEFSCNEGENEVHILGYFLNLEDKIFLERIENLLKSREDRNKKIIELLNNNGIMITIEDVLNEATSRILGRVHFAKALLKKGYCSEIDEAFSKFLGKDGIAYVPRVNCLPDIAVKYIKENGGFVSLAHPKYISTNDEIVISLIERLKKIGLDGIEINYPNFTREDIAKYKTFAKKYDLIYTGGSDFHGENRKNIAIGHSGITYSQLEKIKKKINIIRDK